jgi:ABC-2 type transport system permease protein/lipopolysaccharide transport system permease protein
MVTTRLETQQRPSQPPAGSRYRRPFRLRPALAELWRSRNLVRTLVERDLRVRYKRTVLGFGWAVLTPVVFMVVFTVFFQRAGHFATGGVPYALFVYTVLVPWTFFAQSATLGSVSVIGNLPLLNKVYCPREVFPIAAMFTAAFDTVIATVILLLLFPIYQYPPSVASAWVPLLIAVEVAFTLGFILFISSVLIYLRDLRYIVPILIQVLLFASPVVYALNVIPAGLRPAYAVVDPLGPVLDGFRRSILHGLPPEWGLFGLAAAASVAWLATGYYIFKRLEIGFADIA